MPARAQRLLIPASPGRVTPPTEGALPKPNPKLALSPGGSLARLGDPGAVWRDEGPPRCFLLQPWITIRSTSPIVSVTQQDSGWFDANTFADAAFWVDVGEVTPPAGGSVTLTIESSPTLDEVNFRPVAPPLTLVAAGTPAGAVLPQIIKCVRTPQTAPLSRWVRWRLQSTVGGTPWDATFRIRGTAGSSSFVTPPALLGCILWLRADLGISFDAGTSNVHQWADQSGYGNNANGFGVPNDPTFDVSPIGGQPSIRFDASSSQNLVLTNLVNPNFPITDYAHGFVVHRRLTATESNPAHTGFWGFGQGGGALIPGTDGHIHDDFFSTTAHDCGAPVVPLDTPNVYEVAVDNFQKTLWSNWLNGTLQFTTSTNAWAQSISSALGGSGFTYYPGDWAEVVIYNRILSKLERALLIDYFNGRYALGAV